MKMFHVEQSGVMERLKLLGNSEAMQVLAPPRLLTPYQAQQAMKSVLGR